MSQNNEIKIPPKWITKYKNELIDYTIISPNNINDVKLGDHIKYITYTGELKNGGFILKIENVEYFSKLVFIVKSNIVYRLHYTKNFYVYKSKPAKKTETDKTDNVEKVKKVEKAEKVNKTDKANKADKVII